MKNDISNKLTRYLGLAMAFSVACLLIISIDYSYSTYKKLSMKWNNELKLFAGSILPATVRDIEVGNIEALKIRTEFIVLKERDQNFQIKIVNDKQDKLYESDGFGDPCDYKILTLKKSVTICHQQQIEYNSASLGSIIVSREIRSFYTFFLDSNTPILFFVLVAFLSLLLVTFRYLIRREIILPLREIIHNLAENKNLESGSSIHRRAHEWKVLAHAIQEYKEKIVNYIKHQNEIKKDLEKEKLMSEITAQLAHDIRSPLSALDMIASHIPELDEEKRILIRNATARIHNIANNLLDRNFSRNNNVSTQMFSSIIRTMLFEKREQYKDNSKVSIHEYVDHQMYGAFAKIELNDFKRMLSNLIDNAVQAIPSTGFVRVALSRIGKNIAIEVFDNGKGIPANMISKVIEKGVSQRKGGNGLGLYFVDQKIKEWGGKLEIDSSVEKGTTMRMILKQEPPPIWFVSEIVINDEDEYIVLDDDSSIHEMWKSRILQAVGHNVKMRHFEDEKSFGDWFKGNDEKMKNTTYFFDYELLGNKNSGLDIIERFNLSSSAILVTSHYENEDIQKRCEKIGVRMIPKELAGFVPIVAN
jgi:signal transduction histidine kinase